MDQPQELQKHRETLVLSTSNFGNNRYANLLTFNRLDYNDLELRKRERDKYRKVKKMIKEEDNVEFICKKGQVQSVNQDNLFIMINEDFKIFGIFDGHGPYGHKVSSYVQTRMIQYIKNSKFLTPEVIAETDMFEEVKKALIEIFLTIQDELETSYEEFLDENFPEEENKSQTPTESKQNESKSSDEEARDDLVIYLLLFCLGIIGG